MSKVITNTIRHTGASSDNIELDNAGRVGINEDTSLMDNGTLTIKFGTDKHMGFNSGQGELGSMPGLVAYKDNGSLQDIGIRGDNIRFATGSAERARFTDDGLCLGGTGSANAIDDYEEGTFNPSWGGVTKTNNYNDWVYRKVGNLVYVTGRFKCATTTNNGTTVHGTVPFTPAGNPTNGYNTSVGTVMHHNVDTYTGNFTSYLSTTTNLYFYKCQDNGGWDSLGSDEVAVDDEMIVSLTYITS